MRLELINESTAQYDSATRGQACKHDAWKTQIRHVHAPNKHCPHTGGRLQVLLSQGVDHCSAQAAVPLSNTAFTIVLLAPRL